MSIKSEVKKSLKTGQIKTNNKVANKQIEAYTQTADTYVNALKQLNDEQNQQLTDQTEQSIKGTRQEVQKQYDYNAINQEVQKNQIAERMADYGLTNSGLNFTQQTAVATQRMNADNSVMQYYNNAVNTLRSNLQTAIAENNRQLTSNIAGINYETGNKIADIKSNNAIQNAEIKTQLNANAKDITGKIISSISSTNDKAKNAQSIFTYANTYGLSEKSIKRLLGMAGISWSDYQKWIKNRSFFNTATVSSSKSKNAYSGKEGLNNPDNSVTGDEEQFKNATKTISLHFRGQKGDILKSDDVDEWFDENITNVYTGLSEKQLNKLRQRIAEYTIK